jgi:hypothetical protein
MIAPVPNSPPLASKPAPQSVPAGDHPVTATIQVLGKFVEALGRTTIPPGRK